MNIRGFQESDKGWLIELWQTVFADDPPHNKPSSVIEAKLSVDERY